MKKGKIKRGKSFVKSSKFKAISTLTGKGKKDVVIKKADPTPQLEAMKLMLLEATPKRDEDLFDIDGKQSGWLQIVAPTAKIPCLGISVSVKPRDRNAETENDSLHGKNIPGEGLCYFRLKPEKQTLAFFEDDKSKDELGSYDLKALISIEQPPELACSFRVSYYNTDSMKTPYMGPRTLLLKAVDEDDSIMWAKAIMPWVRAFRASIHLEVPTFKVMMNNKVLVGQHSSFAVITDLVSAKKSDDG
jgi:hypothetical protein